VDRGATSKDKIGYQALTQAALKGVMRAALKKAATLGALPGDHHFYVTFRTRTPGVQMADHLKDRFPDEMMIVIQHQYWDFEVFDDRFEIVLKFSGAPQHLRVPFAAVTRFLDPSLNFGLQFDAGAPADAALLDDEPATPSADRSAAGEGGAAAGAVVSLDAFRRK
jgi:hypothetical protein